MTDADWTSRLSAMLPEVEPFGDDSLTNIFRLACLVGGALWMLRLCLSEFRDQKEARTAAELATVVGDAEGKARKAAKKRR